MMIIPEGYQKNSKQKCGKGTRREEEGRRVTRRWVMKSRYSNVDEWVSWGSGFNDNEQFIHWLFNQTKRESVTHWNTVWWKYHPFSLSLFRREFILLPLMLSLSDTFQHPQMCKQMRCECKLRRKDEYVTRETLSVSSFGQKSIKSPFSWLHSLPLIITFTANCVLNDSDASRMKEHSLYTDHRRLKPRSQRQTFWTTSIFVLPVNRNPFVPKLAFFLHHRLYQSTKVGLLSPSSFRHIRILVEFESNFKVIEMQN